MDILLSICIPTYNRIKDLSEVIDSLLRVSSDAFEIVITDNCSTDSTEQTVCGYSDPRVRYCRNESPLPPFLNMIHSIFNGRGKYALYCNDRDLIYPEGLERLLTHLRDQDLAFVWGPAASGKNDGSLMRYTKGFDSLMQHACIHHPTGMIFNRTLIAAHLAEEEYAQFLPYVNTYDFLMLDLMQYGDTAIYNGGYWGTRSSRYLRKNASGTVEKSNVDVSKLYFSPETRERMFTGITKRVMCDNTYQMDEDELQQVLWKIYLEFCGLFCKYKACMSDEYETAHYGIQRRHIPTAEILRIFNGFIDRSIAYLESLKISRKQIEFIQSKRKELLIRAALLCLKIDGINLYRKIR